MKRVLAICAALLLAFPAAVGAADDLQVERVPLKWQVAGVSRDGLTLSLAYKSDGCGSDVRATVVESRSRIRISVDAAKWWGSTRRARRSSAR